MQSVCLRSAIHVSCCTLKLSFGCQHIINTTFRFEFYVGIVRRTFKGFSHPSCYSATSSDTLLPFIHSTEATPCNVKDTQSIAGFCPGQNILTITMAPDRVGCSEIWTNGSHFLEQGNQKTDSRNYQTTTACPLCRNCASVSAACAGRCSVGGSLQCSDPRMCI